MQCIAHALSSESEIVEQDAEGVTVMTPDGPLRVTQQSLRHWEWMLALLNDSGLAAAFLEQIPEASRRKAETRVSEVWAESFTDVVAEIQAL